MHTVKVDSIKHHKKMATPTTPSWQNQLNNPKSNNEQLHRHFGRLSSSSTIVNDSSKWKIVTEQTATKPRAEDEDDAEEEGGRVDHHQLRQSDWICQLDKPDHFGSLHRLGQSDQLCQLGQIYQLGQLCQLSQLCLLGQLCQLDQICQLSQLCLLSQLCQLDQLCQLGRLYQLVNSVNWDNYVNLTKSVTLVDSIEFDWFWRFGGFS